jgi:hypothetical protein
MRRRCGNCSPYWRGPSHVELAPAVRIWLGTQPVDLRRSFDGLAEQVRQHLQADPLSGHVFVFHNKRSDRLKLLYWDEDGFVIVDKTRTRVSTAQPGCGFTWAMRPIPTPFSTAPPAASVMGRSVMALAYASG